MATACSFSVINFLEKPLNTDAMLIAIETALRLTRDETEASSLRRAAGLAADFLGDSARAPSTASAGPRLRAHSIWSEVTSTKRLAPWAFGEKRATARLDPVGGDT
jgi:hypothetical protein